MSDDAPSSPEERRLSPQEVEAATTVLESIVEDRAVMANLSKDTRERLMTAAGRAARPDKKAKSALGRARAKKNKRQKQHQKRETRATNQALLNQTGIRQMRENPIFETPRRKALHAAQSEPTEQDSPGAFEGDRRCYCCREPYSVVHAFYDQMCVPCGDFNFAKREPTADLSGRVALVTGARVKIGYQAAIMLLRSGSAVHVTTRFPTDAAKRYAAESDFVEWGHRLHVHGIDLRHTPSVEALCAHLLERLDRLDFIINNACQTVRRPPGFYDHLMDAERGGVEALSGEVAGLLATGHDRGPMGAELVTFERAEATASSAELSQVELLPEDRERGHDLFPAGELDADLQQVDLRTVNSWRLKMADVPTIELLEVHLVNAVAPFVIDAKLKPLMVAVPTADKHIVNVSAMEGQFYKTFKTDKHPHTNMAKASLNMMTRTAAMDYVQDGIHMNSVDTGWVTDEDPAVQAQMKREEHDFHPPLDIVDGAARIVDPIFSGIQTGEHVWGQFLKDYKPTDW
jgi:NAD(P)-dependent dehydrogenase (short-subunit alcohol dehydrogenase family)